MKYILILWVFWMEPSPHSEGLIAEPFSSLEECYEAAKRLGDATKADGAVGYAASCVLDTSVEI